MILGTTYFYISILFMVSSNHSWQFNAYRCSGFGPKSSSSIICHRLARGDHDAAGRKWVKKQHIRVEMNPGLITPKVFTTTQIQSLKYNSNPRYKLMHPRFLLFTLFTKIFTPCMYSRAKIGLQCFYCSTKRYLGFEHMNPSQYSSFISVTPKFSWFLRYFLY